MKPDNEPVENSDTKKCTACLSDILEKAHVCKECGTRQNGLTRGLLRVSTISAAVITIISLVTTAIALWPVAYSQIVRDPQARLIRLTFDHPSPDKRTLGSFALFNGGNVDAYVTRVELTAKDNMFDGIGEATFRLYEPLKQGEGFEHDIAYQGAQFRSQVSLQPIILNSETYPRAKAAIKQEGLPLDPCISLFPFNARLGLNAPEDGSFRNANALARLDGTVFFLDRGNPDKEHPSDIRGLYIEAAVMLEPRCLNRLGGREKVVELLAN